MRRPLNFGSQRARRPQHQIISLGHQTGGEGTIDCQTQIIGGFDVQHVTGFGKDDQTVEQVKAVIALAKHVQIKIDLGARELGAGGVLDQRRLSHAR